MFVCSNNEEEGKPESAPTGHVHQKLMAQYAEIAKTSDKPWEDWQIKTVQGTWKDIGFQFIFDERNFYRLKPKTKLVNGVEILDLSFIPENGEGYIVPAVNINFCQNWVANLESAHTAFFIKHGLCYPNTEEGERVAVAHSKALMGVV